MKFEVVITEDAQRDLEEIIEYIDEVDSPAAAAHVLEKLEKLILGLDTNPESGNYPKELLTTGIREYREKHFKPYRVIFRTLGKRILVYLVVDGRRDMMALLSQRLLG